jgi:hypothetical protein
MGGNPHEEMQAFRACIHKSLLHQKQLLPDAFAVIGFTEHDINVANEWNFVFSDPNAGTAFFSTYWYTERPMLKRKSIMDQFLIRSCKSLSVQMMHLMDMHPCIYYECNMAGMFLLLERGQMRKM